MEPGVFFNGRCTMLENGPDAVRHHGAFEVREFARASPQAICPVRRGRSSATLSQRGVLSSTVAGPLGAFAAASPGVSPRVRASRFAMALFSLVAFARIATPGTPPHLTESAGRGDIRWPEGTDTLTVHECGRGHPESAPDWWAPRRAGRWGPQRRNARSERTHGTERPKWTPRAGLALDTGVASCVGLAGRVPARNCRQRFPAFDRCRPRPLPRIGSAT